MTNAFDDRLVNFQLDLDGQTFTYDQNYFIYATGTKYTNGNFADFALRLDNISKATRDFLVTKTSPWVKGYRPVNITLSVGRASYGTFVMCAGQAVAANPSQPPNIGLIFKSLSQVGAMGITGAFSTPPITTLRNICQQVADNLGIPLDYEATQNPNISNYHFTGAVLNQVKKLNDLANINAYIPDNENKLVVTDNGVPRNLEIIEVNSDTGMIGVPEVTEIGARVRLLIRNEVKVGGMVKLTSKLNPAVNGTYWISKLSFEVASRDTPFYWVLDLKIPLSTGTAQ